MLIVTTSNLYLEKRPYLLTMTQMDLLSQMDFRLPRDSLLMLPKIPSFCSEVSRLLASHSSLDYGISLCRLYPGDQWRSSVRFLFSINNLVNYNPVQYISTYINTKMSVCLFVCYRFSRPFRNRLGNPLA